MRERMSLEASSQGRRPTHRADHRRRPLAWKTRAAFAWDEGRASRHYQDQADPGHSPAVTHTLAKWLGVGMPSSPFKPVFSPACSMTSPTAQSPTPEIPRSHGEGGVHPLLPLKVASPMPQM